MLLHSCKSSHCVCVQLFGYLFCRSRQKCGLSWVSDLILNANWGVVVDVHSVLSKLWVCKAVACPILSVPADSFQIEFAISSLALGSVLRLGLLDESPRWERVLGVLLSKDLGYSSRSSSVSKLLWLSSFVDWVSVALDLTLGTISFGVFHGNNFLRQMSIFLTFKNGV